MNRGLSEDALASARTSFAAALRSRAVRAADDLAVDAAVVLDGLAAAAAPGATEVDRNEALALATLLGRRLALADVPSEALLAVLDELERARPVSEPCGPEWGRGSLRVALVDGFARGVREATEAEVEGRVARVSEALHLGGGLVLVQLPALADETRMSSAMDAVGRVILKADAKGCVLWTRPREPSTEALAIDASLQLVEHARMCGAKVAIAAPDPSFREALARRLDAGVPVVPDLGQAVEAVGFAVKENGVLRRWLQR